MSFSIVLIHKPRLHVAVNKGGPARGRNCDNSITAIEQDGTWNLFYTQVSYKVNITFQQGFQQAPHRTPHAR